ncbi:SDR family oxidoreductase [Brevundimonas vesicularis]|uniref:NAD-dependent dehydratase n=1 Tax=Brevundimonas vesicularis TaxID=41276 RepID=A0A1Z3U5T2_BREVE|nr:SDR family oxidoreductase [Brevundimonas vesicularis]ASE38510.1 NAD-dependent dehydratase [Brevundimonas vesicularis]MDX2333502.1 SDR family oxidoreductase [Brevundimonas vesicularis]
MSGRVLVLGANGFIGSHVAAALSSAGWSVRAGTRRIIKPARRAPTFDWVVADFAKLTTPQAWAPLLIGVEAVVNCVGVLQNGAGDSTRAAHVDGPRALIAACEAAGVRRLVHISAVGADDEAGTDYARTKAETEWMIETSGLDWLILRPSLVVDRAAFGGTGLIRALAAFPLFSPVVGGDQIFRPIPLGDLSAAVVAALKPTAPSHRTLDMPGPEPVTMVETMRLYRGWMGLSPAPVIRVPRVLAAPALATGDLLGRLGWSSPIRTTAIKQMDHDVSGRDSGWAQALDVPTRGFTRFLAETPASVQDVWHARLWFVRPISIVTLGLFWLITGLISFGPGWDRAVAILHEGGYGRMAGPIAWWGALLDVVLGLMLFVRPWTARVAIFMCLATVGYLIAGTLSLPHFWIDPLGPWLKVLPMMALCLFVAATDARR